MMMQPNSTTVEATVVDVQPDAGIQGKFWIEVVILSIQKAQGPQFLSAGKLVRGFTFDPITHFKKGGPMQADIEVLGDAFHQEYQLTNIQLKS